MVPDQLYIGIGPVIYRRQTSPTQGTCGVGPVTYRVGPVTDTIYHTILVRVGLVLL